MCIDKKKIFSERTFDLEGGGEIKLILYPPAEDTENANRYKCLFSVYGPDIDITHAAFGADSLQSLILAIRMAGANIYAYRDQAKRNVSWMGMEDDLGLL